jgi:hypothetical protein
VPAGEDQEEDPVQEAHGRDLWKFIDNVIIKPDTFFHVDATCHHTRLIPKNKWKAVKEDLELLLHTFEHVRESHSTPISHSTLQVGDLTDADNCTTGVSEKRMGKKLGGQAALMVTCAITEE